VTCGRNKQVEKKETKEAVRSQKARLIEEEKTVNWAADKEDWERKEEIEMDHQKIEERVPKKFHKWLKVFGKVELERMPVRKVWDHAIDLRENFKGK